MIETNKKIIITRDIKKSAPLAAVLKPYGISCYAVPVTQTVFDVSKTIPEDLKKYNCIAFTSTNAVHAFSRISKKVGFELNRDLKIFAVGSSTAKAVESAFRKPDLVPEKSDAGSLAESIIEKTGDPAPLNVFWPCSADALPYFERILVNAGARVNRWECYRTKALDPRYVRSQLQTLDPWDLVYFAAPSAVKAFTRAWKDKSGFISLAIGPMTEAALKKAGYGRIITSKGTSATETAGAIIDALQLKVWS